ncbi:MAG: S1 RNA-binding domain-containing protein, partial [Terracidiphilus sp.]
MTDETLQPSASTPVEPVATPAENQDLAAQPTVANDKAPAPVESSPSTPAEDQGLDGESFGDLLSAFERSHTHRAKTKQLEGTVVSLSADQVILDIGYKIEGVLPRSAFENNAEAVKPGDAYPVSITGRNEEG